VKEDRKDTLAAETRQRWDRLAKHYGLVEFLSEWYLKPFRETLWSYASGRILEAGAGTGLNIAFYPAGARVTATDLSGVMLSRARERASEQHVDVTFEEADLCSLPFADGSFDTAVATFVFCSMPDPVACLREMGRVTKADGQILLLDHVRIERPLIGPLMDRVNSATVRLAGEHINHRMDESVREAGFEIIESRRLGFMGIIQFIVARPGKDRS
jgi:phosphatidylethanolamine/phosphatidyl-N-methylethanolamine N-methyltransferase